MKFESWMIGQEVIEISTGDRGRITRQKDWGDEGVYIYWTTGAYPNKELWLHLDQITFVSSIGEDNSLQGKLAQIEKLVAEIRAMIGDKK